jgi:hypothetical protein
LPAAQTTVTPLLVGVGDGLAEHGGGEGAAEAHVDDLGAVVGGVADRVGDAWDRAAAVAAEHLERHDRGLEGDAGDAEGVVGGLGDGAGDVGAVEVVVEAVLQRAGDEGLALGEGGAGEVGDLLGDAGEVLPGDAGVDDGDDGTLPAVMVQASGVWIISMCHWRANSGSSGMKRWRWRLLGFDVIEARARLRVGASGCWPPACRSG